MPAMPSCTIAGVFGIARTTGDVRPARWRSIARGRDRRRDRDDRLAGFDQVADLAEQRLDVLRLDGEHDHVGAADRLVVRGRRLDAVPLAQLGGALLAPARRDDVGPVGATQPGEQRLADPARAENCDPHAASLRVRRGIPPGDTHSRARPTPRTARAGRRSPRPRRGGPRAPRRASRGRDRARGRARSGRGPRGRRPRPTTGRALARARAGRATTARRELLQLLEVERPAEPDERGAAARAEPEVAQLGRREAAEVGAGRGGVVAVERAASRGGSPTARSRARPAAGSAGRRRRAGARGRRWRCAAAAGRGARASPRRSAGRGEAAQELGVVVLEAEREANVLDARLARGLDARSCRRGAARPARARARRRRRSSRRSALATRFASRRSRAGRRVRSEYGPRGRSARLDHGPTLVVGPAVSARRCVGSVWRFDATSAARSNTSSASCSRPASRR